MYTGTLEASWYFYALVGLQLLWHFRRAFRLNFTLQAEILFAWIKDFEGQIKFCRELNAPKAAFEAIIFPIGLHTVCILTNLY